MKISWFFEKVLLYKNAFFVLFSFEVALCGDCMSERLLGNYCAVWSSRTSELVSLVVRK